MSKKGPTYTSLLSDLKDSRKVQKGGTYKMYTRNSNNISGAKDEGIRAFQNQSLSKSRVSDKRQDRKLSTSISNMDCTAGGDPNVSNKIDIKISVNYKPSIGDHKTNKSFNRLISQTPQPGSMKNSGYLQYNDVTGDPVVQKEKVTKSLIRNIKDNGRVRNQSDLYGNRGNLNISFNNYENKPQVQNVYNPKMNSIYTPERVGSGMGNKPDLTYLDGLKSSI
jgi:hypothetical protein